MDSQQLQSFFERVYVISLARRPEKLVQFRDVIAKCGWPFREPVTVEGIDGKHVPHPQWFGDIRMNGAWGAMRSHLGILEKCINERVRSVLVLEDDAIPVDGFADKAKAFIESIPPDWQQIYFGGQTNHYNRREHPDTPVNAQVVVPFSVNRLQCYAVNNTGMRTIYKHLLAQDWQRGHHVDHRIETLHRSRQLRVYAPANEGWLIGQNAGKSDVCGRELPVRFFNKPANANGKTPTVIAVVGQYRGGTSAVAGALHNLGIIMGHKFFGGNVDATPKGCFEAKRLFDVCNACYPEPQFTEGQPFARRVQLLRGWLAGRANEDGPIGAKHPKLCLLIPEMLEAWPGCKFVVVHRPIEESAKSLARFGWFTGKWKPGDLIRMLVEIRDRNIEKMGGLQTSGPNQEGNERVFHLDFSGFLRDTRFALEHLAKFAGIEPIPAQYDAALGIVDPNLHHFQTTSEAEPVAA